MRALTKAPGSRVGAHAGGDDAENYGANHGHGDRTTVWHIGIYHDDSDHKACMPSGPKPTHKKLSLGAHFQTGKRKEHLQNTDKAQTQNSIDQDNTIEVADCIAYHRRAEDHQVINAVVSPEPFASLVTRALPNGASVYFFILIVFLYIHLPCRKRSRKAIVFNFKKYVICGICDIYEVLSKTGHITGTPLALITEQPRILAN